MLCLQTDVNTTMHRPVLLGEAVDALHIRPDGCYVDATFGRGGHSREILKRLGTDGRLLGIDRDPAAAGEAALLCSEDSRFVFEQATFSSLTRILKARQWLGRVNGLLLDLGVSSPQLEDASRGFSFRHAGPLDMRMDPETGESAMDWLAKASHGEIAGVIRRYGEEPMAGRIASAIVAARDEGPISDTNMLAKLIADAVPARLTQGKRIHPATRSFQAIRIHINNELTELESVLPDAVDALAVGGRLAVISFHSLEDRIVKRYLRSQAQPVQPALPMAPPLAPALKLVGKPLRPEATESAENPRARSAVLRVAERTGAERVPHV